MARPGLAGKTFLMIIFNSKRAESEFHSLEFTQDLLKAGALRGLAVPATPHQLGERLWGFLGHWRPKVIIKDFQADLKAGQMLERRFS